MKRPCEEKAKAAFVLLSAMLKKAGLPEIPEQIDGTQIRVAIFDCDGERGEVESCSTMACSRAELFPSKEPQLTLHTYQRCGYHQRDHVRFVWNEKTNTWATRGYDRTYTAYVDVVTGLTIAEKDTSIFRDRP
ncbi:MAG: hypothetical protein Q7R83_03485 [bacterium]|nr:hypothetical protein [bacterium]